MIKVDDAHNQFGNESAVVYEIPAASGLIIDGVFHLARR
jgi:hypothetical protein